VRQAIHAHDIDMTDSPLEVPLLDAALAEASERGVLSEAGTDRSRVSKYYRSANRKPSALHDWEFPGWGQAVRVDLSTVPESERHQHAPHSSVSEVADMALNEPDSPRLGEDNSVVPEAMKG